MERGSGESLLPWSFLSDDQIVLHFLDPFDVAGDFFSTTDRLLAVDEAVELDNAPERFHADLGGLGDRVSGHFGVYTGGNGPVINLGSDGASLLRRGAGSHKTCQQQDSNQKTCGACEFDHFRPPCWEDFYCVLG
jgi:hypothetical protein